MGGGPLCPFRMGLAPFGNSAGCPQIGLARARAIGRLSRGSRRRGWSTIQLSQARRSGHDSANVKICPAFARKSSMAAAIDSTLSPSDGATAVGHDVCRQDFTHHEATEVLKKDEANDRNRACGIRRGLEGVQLYESDRRPRLARRNRRMPRLVVGTPVFDSPHLDLAQKRKRRPCAVQDRIKPFRTALPRFRRRVAAHRQRRPRSHHTGVVRETDSPVPS